MRKETMSLYLPSSSLLLARPADLQYGRLHGNRRLPDRLSQDWSQGHKLEVPLRRKGGKLQARLSLETLLTNNLLPSQTGISSDQPNGRNSSRAAETDRRKRTSQIR